MYEIIGRKLSYLLNDADDTMFRVENRLLTEKKPRVTSNLVMAIAVGK
jgi:hypothetical protein